MLGFPLGTPHLRRAGRARYRRHWAWRASQRCSRRKRSQQLCHGNSTGLVGERLELRDGRSREAQTTARGLGAGLVSACSGHSTCESDRPVTCLVSHCWSTPGRRASDVRASDTSSSISLRRAISGGPALERTGTCSGRKGRGPEGQCNCNVAQPRYTV